ncbi:DUF885 domain-containing protein [Marinicella sp. S1101]|uniref:DUF885 domain-containing protein n=1 Tax=Marinicella marina TaxID=2996016 RepID=UPI002260FCA6|nr:DUF885 domain-containing protein [Marinicella marina]MCX7553817.1 DUF885 domain-containing protein [Marinicella marina]MDJ1140893.1 DUF885 domain-containing protein [Marinicella marina]
MKKISLIIILLGISLYAEANRESKKLHKILDEVIAVQTELNPQLAFWQGDQSKAGELNDVSAEFYTKQNDRLKPLLDKLNKIKSKKLDFQDQVSLQMQQAFLQETIADNNFKEYQMPITAEGSFHVNLATMHRYASFNTLDDYKNHLNRMQQVPRVMQQHIENMQAGLARGFTQPQVIIQHYPKFIDTYIKAEPTESDFYQPFLKKPKYVNETDFSKLQQQAKTIITDSINPSYQAFKSFMVKQYIPGARTTIGAHSFPAGEAYYQQQIKEYTTLDLSAEEIHQIGWNEVKRIRAEMEQIISELEFAGSFAEFLHFLRTDPQFYATTADELLKEARDISKRMDGKLPQLFTKLPRQPYAVNPVPAGIAPNYTTGRYVPAPLDSTRPGQYWVNTHALEKRPLYNLEALTFHEAVPGHHLQSALTKELSDLPKFRQNAYISAFGEGWGLYVEKLGKEVGFYQDPYSDFGRLTYEMWRAMRLVVDTGIHAMGMSRDEAIKLMEENTALSKHNVRTEIDRYIAWPAQALSYKLGEIKIWQLRRQAEKELGEAFDIRTFHDAVLSSGSVPLNVLEQIVEQYIEDNKP